MEQVLLSIHFLAMAVGIGGGVATAIASELAAKQGPAVAGPVGKILSTIGDVGFVSLVIIWISGVWLAFAEYGGMSALPSGFWWKFLGVLALSAALIAMQVVKRSAMRIGQPPNAARMKKLGQAALISATFTIVVAAVTFG